MPVCRRWLVAVLLCVLPCAGAWAQAVPAVIRGTVTDSIHRAPLAHAKVTASSVVPPGGSGAAETVSTTTDLTGRFEIKPLAGSAIYLVSVEHPWLDSTGFEVPQVSVDLRTQAQATIALGIPSGATIRAAFCPAIARDSSLGYAQGFLKDANSERPVAAARMIFEWDDFDVDLKTGRPIPKHKVAYASTARDGSYAICGLPVLRPVLMQAQVGARTATGAVEVKIPASGVLVEIMRIDASKEGTSFVNGTVLREGSTAPIAGAHVHLFGALDEVTTAPDGTFHLSDVPFGTQSIEVTALGFRPTRYALDVTAAGVATVNLAMPEAGQVMDTVRSYALRPHVAALREEFDQRSKHGMGQYFTADQISKYNLNVSTDLIRYTHGFRVKADTVFSSRGDLELFGGNVCMPSIFIDGSPADTMNEVLPASIHGIEMYATKTTVPLQYIGRLRNEGSSCGAIFIWTK